MTLLERWVSDLEREAPFSPQEPVAAPRPRANPAMPARPDSDPFSEPKPKPRAPAAAPAPAPAPAPQEAPHSPLRAAREEIRLQGQVATLPPADTRVVLGNEGGRLVHRGTVAVRGPCAPSREELLGLGLTEAHARALEFVLAWFGSPFDSVSWDSQSGGELRWGAWPLSGPTLIAALAEWKRSEPAAFEARLGRLGIDVIPEHPPEPASLRVQGVRSAPPTEGREALTVLGEDPRLVAALAQAGRERGAQLAQLESLIAQVLRPLLTSGAAPVDAPDGPFTTPRALALLFHAELRLGRRGVTRLMAHARERAGQPASGEHAGELFAEALRAVGRAREAAEVWRILASPELADPS